MGEFAAGGDAGLGDELHPDRRACCPKTANLAANDELRQYVQDRLAGVICTRGGKPVPGPATAWSGRNKARRQDRRWATAWSPAQIAPRVRIDFPDDESMRISHEAIYQTLHVQGRGALVTAVSKISPQIAPVVGLDAGAARTALRKAVLAARDGGLR